jgi:hypothetical protein
MVETLSTTGWELKVMKILDLSAAVIIGIISVVFLMMTAELGRTAALFPKILSITIIALVVLYIGMQIYRNRKNSLLKSPGKEAEAEKVLVGDTIKPDRFYIIIGFMGIYMALIYLLGFGVASFVFGIALPYYGGYRRMKVVVTVSLGMAILMVVIGRLFNIPLPSGLWMVLL